uniref:BPTI/Kunitz inhibitor domain-containing protein n=1 Tax=Catagonus wagneri TaxID=51154 RepID=A0A8C3VXS9_9CETA
TERASPPAFCLEPPYTGPCRALFIRYFYNASSGLCETFAFGGCRGKPNNFLDEEECVRTCGGCDKAHRRARVQGRVGKRWGKRWCSAGPASLTTHGVFPPHSIPGEVAAVSGDTADSAHPHRPAWQKTQVELPSR